MATNKVKIQGYIKRDIFEQFEAERIVWGLSHSQAIERILAERYEQNSNASLVDNNRFAALEESLEELNRLCKFSFELAFARIDKLEDFSSESDDQTEVTSDDLPNSEALPHAIVLLNKRNQLVSFWRGGKDGFVEDLDGARHYQGETSAKKQVAKLTKTSVLPEGTRLSYKPVVELIALGNL